MKKPVKIILADDHPVVREGLRLAIELDPLIEIVAEAGNGVEAIERIKELKPDLAVLDIDMPEKNGFEVARWIGKNEIGIEIIFLTMHKDEGLFNEALDLGAKGFILKDSLLADIVNCIKQVAKSEHYVSHSLTSFLMSRTRRAINMAERQPSIQDLTPAERKVLRHISNNLTTKEIAEKLFVSSRTVDAHRSNISKKLQLKGSHALLKFALSNKSQLL